MSFKTSSVFIRCIQLYNMSMSHTLYLINFCRVTCNKYVVQSNHVV